MRFETDTQGALEIAPTALTVAGWTGRDAAAVEHHIAELAEIGVPRPSAVPLYYRCAPSLLTQADRIAALGTETSGEAEPFLLRAGGALWLGLGSDHTDRGLEAHSVAHSKQICAKPVARSLWAYEPLADRLDALELRSWISEAGGWTLYQEGTLAAIRPLAGLLAASPLAEGEAMLCGTLPARGGVRPSASWRMELRDPAAGRALKLAYAVETLPVVA
jgi:hypothetical protein